MYFPLKSFNYQVAGLLSTLAPIQHHAYTWPWCIYHVSSVIRHVEINIIFSKVLTK